MVVLHMLHHSKLLFDIEEDLGMFLLSLLCLGGSTIILIENALSLRTSPIVEIDIVLEYLRELLISSFRHVLIKGVILKQIVPKFLEALSDYLLADA